MYKGTNELTAIAADISLLASQAPERELPGVKGVATVALSGATMMTVMGSPAGAGEYTVQRGDTLSHIAEEAGSTVDELAAVNNINNPDLIYADTTLHIPDTIEPATVTVEQGESPWSVARNLLGTEASQAEVKTLADKIIDHNSIRIVGRRAILSEGSVLEIPDYHKRRIQKGETAERIAKQTNVELPDLRDRNGDPLTDPNRILADDSLIVPVAPGNSVVIESVQPTAPLPEVPAANVTNEPAAAAPAPLIIESVPSAPVQPEVKVEKVYDYSAIGDIHGVKAELIQEVTAYMMKQHGLTEKGAAYLTGNFIQESQLDPHAVGDNGSAFGIAQWRFERRNGMPEGELYAQIDFALSVEMDRDGLAADLNELLRDPNATDSQIRDGLKRWERWGHEGKRFEFAYTIEQAITATDMPVAVEQPAPVKAEERNPKPNFEQEKAHDPLDHPLIDKTTRRHAPGRGGETIDIVEVAGQYVHIDIAENTAKMIEHAHRDGVNLTLTSAWRDIAEQEQLRIDNDCPDIYESSASSCRIPTAIPGTSMHNGGEALDIGENGNRLSDNAFNWLQSNAGSYGFKNLPSEPWHWSTNGK